MTYRSDIDTLLDLDGTIPITLQDAKNNSIFKAMDFKKSVIASAKRVAIQ